MTQARSAMRSQTVENARFDQITDMRAAGITAEYVNAIRSAQPRLRYLEPAGFAGIKSVGVTPEFARDLAAAGFGNLSADQLAEARAIGLSGDYARWLAVAGVPLNFADYVQLRAVGVPASFIAEIRKSGHAVPRADKIVEMWAVGVTPDDLRAVPAPPKPTRSHAAPNPPEPESDPGG